MRKYTQEKITSICDEIECQWEYHLVCRAVFHADVSKEKTIYCSPPYYKSKNIYFAVQLPQPQTGIMRKALKGVPGWLNQNFILRLFGILDGNRIITAGKEQDNVYTKIVAELRHRVGAHSPGTRQPTGTDAKRISKLIHNHLDPNVLPENISGFNLSIDTVLEPLKNNCISFIKSLQGKVIPEKKVTCCK